MSLKNLGLSINGKHGVDTAHGPLSIVALCLVHVVRPLALALVVYIVVDKTGEFPFELLSDSTPSLGVAIAE